MTTLSEHQQSILDYYDTCWVSRFEAGHNPQSLAMHMGYFQDGNISNDAAKLNMNRYVAELLQLNEHTSNAAFHLVDAGCGVGGTSLYLARQFPLLQIHAVNIAASQLAFLQNKITDSSLSNIQLVQADYCNMPLPDSSFDGIIAVESLCHAHEKSRFFKEAYRILKPGGKLLVLDYLQTAAFIKDLESQKKLADFQKGWAVSAYLTQPEMLLENAGFPSYTIHNITEKVRPGIEHSFHTALHKIKLLNGSVNHTMQRHLNACVALKDLIDIELIQYIAILAEKPLP